MLTILLVLSAQLTGAASLPADPNPPPGIRPCDQCDAALRTQLGSAFSNNVLRVGNGNLVALHRVLAGRSFMPLTDGIVRKFCSVMRLHTELCPASCLEQSLFVENMKQIIEFCGSYHKELFRSVPCLAKVQRSWQMKCQNLSDSIDTVLVEDLGSTDRDKVEGYKLLCRKFHSLISCETGLLASCSADDIDRIFRWRFSEMESKILTINRNVHSDLPRECIEVIRDTKPLGLQELFSQIPLANETRIDPVENQLEIEQKVATVWPSFGNQGKSWVVANFTTESSTADYGITEIPELWFLAKTVKHTDGVFSLPVKSANCLSSEYALITAFLSFLHCFLF